jgi:hypothetical protein
MSFRFEPAVWLGLARTVIYVAGLFGVGGVDQWTEEQQAGAVLLVEAVTGVIQRSVVTPNARL